jgi:hypothetical protein
MSEQEKNILSSVYAMAGSRGKEMLDYEKLDQAFEAVQQQLYSSGKSKFNISSIFICRNLVHQRMGAPCLQANR